MADYKKLGETSPLQSATPKPSQSPEQLAELNTPEQGLTSAEAERRLMRDGPNSVPEQKNNPYLHFLSYYWGPMPCMIWISIVIEIIRNDVGDVLVLLALQFSNGFIGWYEERNAGNAIEALKKKMAPRATVKRDGEWRQVPSSDLVVGDRINLKLGDIIPADAKLAMGFLEIDQSVLTGESLALTKYEGEEVYQGAVIKRGDVECIVTNIGSNTFFGKSPKLLNEVQTRGNFQKVLMKTTAFLMVISFILVTIIMIVVLSKGNSFLEILSVCVVILVASIPIAMQVVCATTMAVGAHKLALKKAIVSRLNAIEELAGIDILCTDKTGTLTKNELTVQKPRLLGSWTMEDIFLCAALAAKRSEGSQDAIDKCVTMTAVQGYGINFEFYEEEDFVPFDPRIKRTEATLRDKRNGETFKSTKGAPQVILAMCEDESIVEDVSRNVEELASRGYRTLGVARTDKSGKWVMLGLIPLYDPPRDDTAETIQKAQQMEVNVKMITGDQTAIAKETARLLKMGDRIYNSELLSETASETQRQLLDSIIEEADGFAEVFPEHKFAIVKHLQDKQRRVAMTGDGVNDAPALKKAEVGIAVDGATDAAKAASDIVLTLPGLSVIVEAIFTSRKIFQRMKNYCVYRIACTVQLLIFFFTTMVGVDPRSYPCNGHEDCKIMPNAFSLPVIALAIITLLNDGTIISIAYDSVTVSKKPEKWNLTAIFAISILQGAVAYLSSLICLLICLDNMNSEDPNIILNSFGVGTFSYGEVLTAIYLKVSISDFMTIYASRTSRWFWTRKASKILNIAFVIAALTASLLALFWGVDSSEGDDGTEIPPMRPVSIGVVLLVWALDIIFFILQDLSKVLAFQMLEKYYRLTNPTKEVFTTHYLTDTFLVFTTGYEKGGAKRSIVTRRSMAAAKAMI